MLKCQYRTTKIRLEPVKPKIRSTEQYERVYTGYTSLQTVYRVRVPASMKLNLIPASPRPPSSEPEVSGTRGTREGWRWSATPEKGVLPGARDWPDILQDPATHIANYQLYDPLALRSLWTSDDSSHFQAVPVTSAPVYVPIAVIVGKRPLARRTPSKRNLWRILKDLCFLLPPLYWVYFTCDHFKNRAGALMVIDCLSHLT